MFLLNNHWNYWFRKQALWNNNLTRWSEKQYDQACLQQRILISCYKKCFREMWCDCTYFYGVCRGSNPDAGEMFEAQQATWRAFTGNMLFSFSCVVPIQLSFSLFTRLSSRGVARGERGELSLWNINLTPTIHPWRASFIIGAPTGGKSWLH